MLTSTATYVNLLEDLIQTNTKIDNFSYVFRKYENFQKEQYIHSLILNNQMFYSQ